MRKPWLLVALLGLASGAAVAQVSLNTGSRIEFTDCASGGSSSTSTTARTNYLLRVTDKDTFICYAATCATGGEKFPLGTILFVRFEAVTALSCRSSDSTGDVILTKVN